MSEPSSQRIIDIGMGFWPARTLQVAVKLGLFTLLGARAMTGEELRDALGLAPRANPDFFDMLVALKFLEREGEGPEAAYSNSQEAARFLDRASPDYMGVFIEMAHDRLYPFWTDLGEALRTGKPQNEVKHTGKPLFAELYADPVRLESFMASMGGVSTPNFRKLAETFDFSPYETLCDVGGASAVLSVLVARANPHLHCVSADLPAVEPIAQRRIAEAGLSDRVGTAVIDFFEDPLPQADVITMGMILHDWDLPTKQMLIRKAYEALPEGGVFIAIENLIDDARRENVFGLGMSLNMIVQFGDAFDFTGADFAGWCEEAGFSRCEVLPLTSRGSAAIAYK
jgi:hypothetical protein